MATVDSAATAVIPAGYYTSQGFQSLSVSQQAAATGAQGLLDAKASLFSSLYGSNSPAPTVLSVQVNGADSTDALAIDTGEQALQKSQSDLLSTMSSTSGWLPTSVFQLNLLQTLTRSGLLGYQSSSPSASQAVATGEVAQANNRENLLDTLPGSEESSALNPLSAYLSQVYSQTGQYSLAGMGSGVGGSVNVSI